MTPTLCPCCRKSPVTYAYTQAHRPDAVVYSCEACRPGAKVHPVINPTAAPIGRDYQTRAYSVRYLG